MPSFEIHSSKSRNVKNFSAFPIAFTEATPSNSFPWNIELNDFNCRNVSNAAQTVFLPSVQTKITLDLTTKAREIEASIDDMSFVIHLDTTPIDLHLRTSQVRQIYESVLLLSSLAVAEKKRASPVALLDSSASIYDAQINDFICETTNSERSSEDVVSEVETPQSNISFLIQWTITRFGFSLAQDANPVNIELLIELEDVIMSVDKQSTYTKVRTKFGSLNGVRKRLSSPDAPEDMLKILGRTETLIDEAQQTFFEMVSTTAIAKNVHSRWGATMSKKALGFREVNDTITELSITMQSIDIKLELDILAMLCGIADEIGRITVATADDAAESATKVTSVRDLPLIFFDCKGVQLWIPMPNETAAGTNTDVLIAKVRSHTFAFCD